MIKLINPRGNNKAISISKIRKMIVKRKNFKEKGARAFLIGLNPHSKVIIFSRSFVIFFLISIIIIVSNLVSVKEIKIARIRVNINL